MLNLPPYLPGPMEGIMHPAWIRAAGHWELAEHWITPFFRLSAELPRQRLLRAFLTPFSFSKKPITVQLMGTDPGLLAEAAAAFIELGAAGIDFNFGCPSRRVVSGGAGGGALKNPQWMRKILATTRRMLPTAIPVSAKIRTGWHSPEEMDRIIPEILSDGAVSFLTVHFRTVTEQYQPVPGRERRWARAIQLAAGIPVVLNGDLATVSELQQFPLQLGAAGAMAARGFLRDPWLLRRAAAKSAPDPETGRQHFFETVIAEAETEGGLFAGRAIELSNFLWGKANPYFEALKHCHHAVTLQELPSLKASDQEYSAPHAAH